MGHRIEERDAQQSVEMQWHGLTRLATREEFKLDWNGLWLRQWDAVVKPLSVDSKPSGFSILTGSDDGEPIGQPFNPDTYTPFTNAMLLDLIERSISGCGMVLESCGSVRNRERVFLSFRVPESDFEVAGKVFKSMLNFFNGLGDRETQLGVNSSNTCIVCDNTFEESLHDTKGSLVNIRGKHTKNLLTRIENIPQIIAAAATTTQDFKAGLVELAKVPCDRNLAGYLALAFFGKRDKEELATITSRGRNRADAIVALFSRGAGNRGESLMDLFQAGTDYFSHESRGGNDRWAQWVSSSFGNASNHKHELLAMLRNPIKREEAIQLGTELAAQS